MPPKTGDDTSGIPNGNDGLEGLAVRNGILVASLPATNQLLFVDARAHKVIGTFDLNDPHGLAFDKTGRLLAISDGKLLRFTVPAKLDEKIDLSAPQTLVSQGLDDPRGLALDKAGRIYVANRGDLHQVKVFAPDGKFVRAIGKAGTPQVGPYDELQMQNPYGIAIVDGPQGERLWVAEQDYKPKRLSVWNVDGGFVRAFYGPTIYGGGGTFDPADKTRFFHDGIEFKVDWKTGEDVPVNIYYRKQEGALRMPTRWANKPPETPIRAGNGQLYLTDAYTGHPTNGISNVGIYKMRDGAAKLVAAAGLANDWAELKKPRYAPLLPKGTDLTESKKRSEPGETAFAWSDLNDNGAIDLDEIQFRKGWHWGGTTVLNDLTIVFPRFEPPRADRFHRIRRAALRLEQSRQAFRLERALVGWRRPNPRISRRQRRRPDRPDSGISTDRRESSDGTDLDLSEPVAWPSRLARRAHRRRAWRGSGRHALAQYADEFRFRRQSG